MTVRNALLALLAQGPCHGYQLKHEFETRTGNTWPLLVGQVYSTLDRLLRDGLIDVVGTRDDGTQLYGITGDGRSEVDSWFYDPGNDEPTLGRDELPAKITLALTLPGVDVGALVQAHRRAAMHRLQELNVLKRDRHRETGGADLSWELTLDAAVFGVKARVQWLDHAEAKIVRGQGQGTAIAYPLDENAPRRGRPRGSMSARSAQ